MTAATDQGLNLKRAFSEMASVQPEQPNAQQIPEIRSAFNGSGLNGAAPQNGMEYASTPMEAMGQGMRDRLSPLNQNNQNNQQIHLDMNHINLHRQGMQEMSGIRAEPKDLGVLNEGANRMLEVGGEALQAIGNLFGGPEPEPDLQLAQMPPPAPSAGVFGL
ncbi:MAG: hypothetical protein WC989_06580 [Micavibrio sp.]